MLLAQDLKFLDSEAALGVQLLYSASAGCAATSFWVPRRQHLRLAAWYAFRFPARVIPFVLACVLTLPTVKGCGTLRVSA